MPSAGTQAFFRRLVVCLDPLAPQRGAFAHSLDWAVRLQVPIHAIAFPGWSSYREGNRVEAVFSRNGRGRNPALSTPSVAGAGDETEQLEASAAACTRSGVRLELSQWEGYAPSGVRKLLQPTDLFVIGNSLEEAQNQDLFRPTLGDAHSAVLVCPSVWTPLTRVLVLDQGKGPAGRFLVGAAQIGRHLGATPVVLTVARSEPAAHLRQQSAREALASQGWLGDFDFMVGADVCAAVAGVAHWRRCQLVVLEWWNTPSWWRWLWGDTMERLIGHLGSLAFLVLPHADSLNSVPERAGPPEQERSLSMPFLH